MFEGLPDCILRSISSRSERVAGTEGSWDEKQGTFPRLAVRYRETVDSNIGDHISARLQTIHGFKNVFENPNGLYEGFKAHQLQKCTCSAQDPGFMGGI